MAVPTYDQLMLPLMKLLAEQTAPIKVSEVVELLAECSKLSNDELEQTLPSGKNIFKDRVAWAKTYLVKAGLVQQPKRAFCEISELGRSINLNGLNSITNDFLSQFDSFRDYKFSRSNKFETENSLIIDREININEYQKIHTPEEIIENTTELLVSSLKSDLLKLIKNNSPQFFEKLVVDLLVAMGVWRFTSRCCSSDW